MKKTAIHQLIEELESLKHLTDKSDKKEAFIIAIGLAKIKLELEEKQIKEAFDGNYFANSSEDYFRGNYEHGF